MRLTRKGGRLDAAGKIVPLDVDIQAVDAKHGKLPHSAPPEAQAERYRLYQAAAAIRMWENGELPLDVMRHMDSLAGKSTGS